MAHFLGAIKGSRGEETRLGTKSSGMDARAQGWNIGARVYAYHDPTLGDCVRVELTRGSNGNGHNLSLGTFRVTTAGEYEGVDDYGKELIDLATEYGTLNR